MRCRPTGKTSYAERSVVRFSRRVTHYHCDMSMAPTLEGADRPPVSGSAARVTELRLKSFKNYKDQVVPLHPLTLIVGPNASGKSNALDAFALLALLADERDVADLERDDVNVAGLRGNLSGAAPYSTTDVSVGCTIESGDGHFFLDITFDVSGRQPEIAEETLAFTSVKGRHRRLLHAVRRSPGEGLCDVEVYSAAQPRYFTMLTSRLVTLQALTKVPQDSAARRAVARDCAVVVDTLRSIFVMDPVPGLMRGYARIGDSPNRTGSTTSAVVRALRDDRSAWQRLTDLIKGLVGETMSRIEFAEASLPQVGTIDVMVALREKTSPKALATASVMSDGTLRYLAIVATLLSLGRDVNTPAPLQSSSRKTFLVEEVENGLYPQQAANVLDLLRRETQERGVTLVATTHSPALLDALKPDDHAGVLICSRSGETGLASLAPLIDHPNYLQVAAGGRIGAAVSAGELDMRPAAAPSLEQLDAYWSTLPDVEPEHSEGQPPADPSEGS